MTLVRESLTDLYRELPSLMNAVGRARTDAGEGRRLRELLEAATKAIQARLRPTQLEDLATKLAHQTSAYQRGQLDRQVKAALGADIFIGDRKLPAIIEGFAAENVSLIKDLPAKVLADIEKTVTRGVANATPHTELAKEIDERLAIGEDRAKLIARDQVGKLYGQINAERQQELGVDKFIWRTAQDERVRSEHQARDGNEYSYSNPPDGELPGEPVNCRCYAEPVFTEILQEVENEG